MLVTRPSRTIATLALAVLVTGTTACGLTGSESNAIKRIQANASDATAASNLTADTRNALDSGAARVGILWRGLGGGDETMITQEITVSGSFPDAFTLELAESPPLFADAPSYITGVMVLLDDNAELGVRLPGDLASGSVLPQISENERAQFGIVSIPPIYVTFVADDGNGVIDANFDNDETLAPGYHMAQFVGIGPNEANRYYNCLYYEQRDDCGEYYYDLHPEESTPNRLGEEDTISIVVGGPDDLIHTLRPAGLPQ